MANFSTIKKRSDFVRMNSSAARFVVSNFILQMSDNKKLAEDEIRIGYTVTKKLGNAVIRNRIKRRLRESFRRIASESVIAQRDYVIIARSAALKANFTAIISEMKFAFSKIKYKQVQ